MSNNLALSVLSLAVGQVPPPLPRVPQQNQGPNVQPALPQLPPANNQVPNVLPPLPGMQQQNQGPNVLPPLPQPRPAVQQPANNTPTPTIRVPIRTQPYQPPSYPGGLVPGARPVRGRDWM